MEVVGSDGAHVGTVDEIEGTDKIKLTKSDPVSGGIHHWIMMSDIDRVDDKVHLRFTATEAMQRQAAELR